MALWAAIAGDRVRSVGCKMRRVHPRPRAPRRNHNSLQLSSLVPLTSSDNVLTMRLKKLSPDHQAYHSTGAQQQWEDYITAARVQDENDAEAGHGDSPLSSAPPSPGLISQTPKGNKDKDKEKEKEKEKVRCPECGAKVRTEGGKIVSSHKIVCVPKTPKKATIVAQTDKTRKRTLSDASVDTVAKKKKSATNGGGADEEVTDASGTAKKKTVKKEVGDKGEKSDKADAKSTGDKLSKEDKSKGLKAKKMGRNKGPVDVNVQCGVLIPPDNIPCARSLTCKTHSMGAKRSVPGRSASYDVLLFEWQKQHNPNFGDRKVVTPRVGPGIEPGGKKKKKDPSQVSVSAVTSTIAESKLLGEVDDDFRKPHRHHSQTQQAAQLHLSVPSSKQHQQGEEDDDEDSDDEAEMIWRGVEASRGGKPLVDQGMGSAWICRWSKFGKMGLVDRYRDAFIGGAAKPKK